MQLITTRKVAQYHMIIKLINISYMYITKFLYISTDFVQWIVIVTSKSMHLVFHAKKGPKLELVLLLTIISLFLSLDPF